MKLPIYYIAIQSAMFGASSSFADAISRKHKPLDMELIRDYLSNPDSALQVHRKVMIRNPFGL